MPSKAPERQTSLDPKRAEAAPKGRTTFDIDPIADSAMIGVSLGFYATLEAINSTGEIRPLQIAPNFDTHDLIGIDRSAVTIWVGFTPLRSLDSERGGLLDVSGVF